MNKAVHATRADWGFWQSVIVTTATGCVLDTVLLTAFAFSGAVAMIVPVSYGACGLSAGPAYARNYSQGPLPASGVN
jgi:hypothetical protein